MKSLHSSFQCNIALFTGLALDVRVEWVGIRKVTQLRKSRAWEGGARVRWAESRAVEKALISAEGPETRGSARRSSSQRGDNAREITINGTPSAEEKSAVADFVLGFVASR